MANNRAKHKAPGARAWSMFSGTTFFESYDHRRVPPWGGVLSTAWSLARWMLERTRLCLPVYEMTWRVNPLVDGLLLRCCVWFFIVAGSPKKMRRRQSRA